MDAIIRQTVREEIRRQGQNNNERVESASTSSKPGATLKAGMTERRNGGMAENDPKS